MNFIDLDKQYKIISPRFNKSLIDIFKRKIFIGGKYVSSFEENLSDYTNVKYVKTCANGTDALYLALKALNIGSGDEVITTSFTFVSTVESIKNIGATPVFCDIDQDTYNINHNLIEKLISKKTKCIIAVSLFGQTSDLKSLKILAKKYGIYLIEDGAQSFGAIHYKKKSLSIADISCTSFYPSKSLSCAGDGGAVFTNQKSLFVKIKEIANHGQGNQYFYNSVGINSRLDSIQAALLIEKLKILDSEIKLRNKKALFYNNSLRKKDFISLPLIKEYNTSVYSTYTIRINKNLRKKIINNFKKNNIPYGIYYPKPLHLQKPYFQKIHLPITEKVAKEVISLPFSPYISKSNMQKVIKCLKI